MLSLWLNKSVVGIRTNTSCWMTELEKEEQEINLAEMIVTYIFGKVLCLKVTVYFNCYNQFHKIVCFI